MFKYMMIGIVLFCAGCSPYLMSNAYVGVGTTTTGVIAAWGQPFERKRMNTFEIWTYGLAPIGPTDYRTTLLIENGRVTRMTGYKVDYDIPE